MPGFYTPRFAQEIKETQGEAARTSAQANITRRNAAGYLSNTVLFAAVLFFAGTAGKFAERSIRLPSLIFALVQFLFVAVRMILLPVA